MIEIQNYIVQENVTAFEAMKHIDSGARGIVFVCRGMKLCAVVTDGDIRRYILQGGDLSQPVIKIASLNPVYLTSENELQAADLMQQKSITAVPIVNSKKEIVDIRFWREVIQSKKEEKKCLDIPLVIMAGGKGTRLKPYTDILPKPLIPVGDKTITEHIMDRFAEYQCNHVTMIVNYKKDFIKAYFAENEIKRNITFLEEQDYLGTGGGLRLLSGLVEGTFFMSNCDILIEADYADILEYHKKSGNILTMICVKKRIEIPYGTVQLNEENQIVGLKEKPGFDYLINTGFYVIEPEFIECIPKDTFVHITDVIEKSIADGNRIGSYIIEDDAWMDMGQLDELEKMKEKMGII